MLDFVRHSFFFFFSKSIEMIIGHFFFILMIKVNCIEYFQALNQTCFPMVASQLVIMYYHCVLLELIC